MPPRAAPAFLIYVNRISVLFAFATANCANRVLTVQVAEIHPYILTIFLDIFPNKYSINPPMVFHYIVIKGLSLPSTDSDLISSTMRSIDD